MKSLAAAACIALAGCATQLPAPDAARAREQVFAAERAFARSMADRDLQAFSRFVSDEAVFFSGPSPLRGRQQVVDWWSRHFVPGTPAPFSWDPDQVEVLASGTLALSSGPVKDPAGKVFARFTSVWRLEAPGQWRIVFDRGNPVVPERQ